MSSAPELNWLPDKAEWADTLKLVATGDHDSWHMLVGLANARLDLVRTIRLDRAMQRLLARTRKPPLAGKPVRLAVLGSSTLDHLLASIRVGGLRRGIYIDTYLGSYGQYRQELFDPGSELHRFRPNAVLFALDAQHMLAETRSYNRRSGAEAAASTQIEDLRACWRIARDNFGCQVLQQTILPMLPSLMGGNEHRLLGSPRRLADQLNEQLRIAADTDGVDILAIDHRAAEDGLAAWYDPVLWHRAKQEVHPAAAPLYGDLVARLLAAQQGRSFKCLALDLDNTLWGGVIGDDGLEGIVLGQGSAAGEAFVAFQRYAQALSQRGIILAVCSKNDDNNARLPFEAHPDMILRPADIACFVANWDDKPANLRRIAERLNIGIDAIVFVDDNPFERHLVRRELPQVAVPELPDDPALYARCLAQAGYFEALQVTDEDLERTRQYQETLSRESLRASATDLRSYLESLRMELRWQPFERIGLPRIVQLINKTNQFNLTTRRYTEAEICEAMADPRVLTLQLRLVDQFGDNGIIGIVIGRFEENGSDMLLDTWLMSCRVLGRQVEEATLNLVAAQAAELGAHRLIGEYRPTAKNGMVREHYAKLGFTTLAEFEGGRTRWTRTLPDFDPYPTFIGTIETR